MRDALINEAVIAAAKERITQVGTVASMRRLLDEEPDLYVAISSLAVTALADLDEVTEEMQAAVHRNVWFAALTALESYRLAYYRLWRGLELGNVLERFDPSITKPPRLGRPTPDGPRNPDPEYL